MKAFFLLLLLFFSSLLLAQGHATKYENPFSIVYGGAGVNIYGDYTSIASSVQCVTDSSNNCDYNYNGFLFDATTKYENSVSTATIPLNSSTETLTLPADIDGSDILYAGLYWQGNITGADSANYATGIVGRNIVSLQDANGTVQTLTADKIWYHDFWGNGTGSGGGYRSFYQGYKDVTSIVQNSYDKARANNNFTVGNIKSTIGTDYATYFWGDDLYAFNGVKIGFWGNWNLIVVYQHSDINSLSVRPKPKNITLFQGFDALIPLAQNTSKSVTLPLSGFLTPSTLPIEAKLLFYGAGAEKQLSYDTFKIQDKKTVNFIDLSNALNPIDDAFNGSVSSFGIAIDNNISYYPGLDSDEFDISAAMDSRQTSTSLSLTAKNVNGTGDQIFPGLIAFSTDVFEPVFCYDYAYKQQNIYFTEDNNGTKDPRLVGDVITSEPIELSIYIRNFVDSDIQVTDMNLSILDMNTSQVTYKRETTSLAKIGDIVPTAIADASLNVADAYIKNINIGTIAPEEYFFTYYSLDPQITDLNMSINIQADYNLIVDGVSIPYSLTLGSQIYMCSNDNFAYTPQKGIFNVVDNDYYNSLDTYYNLPTQITSREGNFKVIALDPNNLDTLKGVSTTVAVEMIDASAFHEAEISCQEQASSISERVWVMFDNNTSSTMFDKNALTNAIGLNNNISSSSQFYNKAEQNAAFRISYNVTNNPNEDLVQTQEVNGTYKILNFSEIVQTVGACVQPVVYPLNATQTGIATQAAQACGNSGNFISAKHLQACMECIYGISTKKVCSRDNFAIRPEAFMIKLKDQNQTIPTLQPILDDTISGVVSPSGNIINMAAGYKYNIKINATNFLNTNPSSGYTKSFTASTTDKLQYIFEPRAGHIVSGCNDTNNISSDIRFVNGLVDTDTFVNQVGEYRLNIADTTWTAVDSSIANMSHHTAPYFKMSGVVPEQDCIAGSALTQVVNSATLNGCDINSTLDSSGSNLKYRDYYVTLHPYKFNMTGITPTIGLNNTALTSNAFIYMSDMSKDENMSFHLNGLIQAVGYNDLVLNNFVASCYAKTLDINISKSDTTLVDTNNNFVLFQARFHDLNLTNQIITLNNIDSNETDNLTPMQIQIPEGYFISDLNGSLNTILNLNYNRKNNLTVNPIKITYNNYRVNCSVPSDCNFSADSDFVNNLVRYKTAQGTLAIDNNITHYYGRTHAPRYRFSANINQQAFIYYEVFCNGAGCDKTLLQNSTDSNSTDDPRWFINTNHTSIFGTAGVVTQRGASLISVVTPPTGNHQDSVFITYDGSRGNPYKATMQNSASGWLIYNKYDTNATKNEFEVEFEGAGNDWVGNKETNTTTLRSGTNKTNRRSMW